MANAKLYPYVQMIGEGDNITFLWLFLCRIIYHTHHALF
jgi:hypothetical protein